MTVYLQVFPLQRQCSQGELINVDCFLYSDDAEEPPRLEPEMGFLKLESLKDALGETWMLMGKYWTCM